MPIDIGGTIWPTALANALDYKSIIKTGLVLHLDPKVAESYPGSGTSWYDLSGNNIHGTLVNGPTYSSTNSGIISFDGVNDYMTTTYNSIYQFNNVANFSMCAWFMPKSTTIGKQDYICQRATYGANERTWEWSSYTQTSTTASMWFGIHNGNWTYINNTSIRPVNINQWNYCCVTLNGAGSGKIYVNNSLTDSNNSMHTGLSATTVPLQLGGLSGSSLSDYGYSSMGHFLLYNRELTAQEVAHNFNATRDRYGI